jgi:hypothetical protein
MDVGQNWSGQLEIHILYGPRVWGAQCHVTALPSELLAALNLQVTDFVPFNRFIFECSPEIVGMW